MTRQLGKAMAVAADAQKAMAIAADTHKAMEAAARAQAALEKIDARHLAALRERDEALRFAHAHGATVRQLAKVVELSPAAVSKAVRRTREGD